MANFSLKVEYFIKYTSDNNDQIDLKNLSIVAGHYLWMRYERGRNQDSIQPHGSGNGVSTKIIHKPTQARVAVIGFDLVN